jgi:carboxypeptidase C (cathepsin A)
MRWLASFLALSFATGNTAQFVPAPTNLITAQGHAGIPVRYKNVPVGICEKDSKVKSFAGYSDVAPHQHIFWWFFEARTEPEKAPLTVWINGGPGFVLSPSRVDV